MSRNQNLAAVGLLLALGAATTIWLVMRGGDEPAARTAPTAGSGSAATASAGSGSAAGSAAKPRVRRLADPAGREELLRQIRALRARRAAPATASSTGSATPSPALPDDLVMKKEYIRASVRDLIPLLVECYEEGLERDPKLAGSVVVRFTIEGEPAVGGVIGESSINAEESTLPDPAVRECIQETMFAIEIEPPADGETVTVNYPFVFRPAAPE